VRLQIAEEPAGRLKHLQVQTERGLSIITLGVDDGEGYNVRSYTNSEAQRGRVMSFGDCWPSESMCTDFTAVIPALEEFCDTGDVSKEILS
jgi:hypothetical protein